MLLCLFDSGYELYKVGEDQGPTTAVTKNYENGKELVYNVVSKTFGEHASV